MSFRRARRAALALLLTLCVLPLAGAANASGKLQPTPLGHGMCQARAFADGSVQAQIAVSPNTSTTLCSVATGTLGPAADQAQGAPFHAGGFTCKATREGAGSPWAAAWSGTYYAYNCASGTTQVAFNWGRHYTYGSGGSSGTSGMGGTGGTGGTGTGTGTPTFSAIGHHLLPTALGHGMCQAQSFTDGSVQAQIAVYKTTCFVATGTLGPAADQAQGAPFHAGGFTCKATREGAGSRWAAAWSGTYYAYTCASGTTQVAFNWGRHYTY